MPARQDVAAPNEPNPQPAQRRASRRGWRLVRLAAGAVVVASIVAGSMIAWPIVHARLIAPIGENTADVGELRARIAELQGQVDEMTDAQGAAATRVDAVEARLDERLAEHAQLLDDLDAMDRSLAGDDRAAQADVAREVSLLKAMELMSRARLFLYQSNFGLAAQDLEAARAILADLDDGVAGASASAIAVAVERLDRSLEALPDFPVVASDDLDIAWQALLGNVPSQAPEPTAEASP